MTVAEAGLAGHADSAVLTRAVSAGRAGVTANVRDVPSLHSAQLTSAVPPSGIVCVATQLSLRQADLGGVITALHHLLVAIPTADGLRHREARP